MVLRGSIKSKLDKRLKEILTPREYSFDKTELAFGAMHAMPIRADLASLFETRAGCVIIPSSAEKAALVLKTLAELNLPVTIRGGGNDPSGASLVTMGEVLLLTRGLSSPPLIDSEERTVEVEAGIDMSVLEAHLNPAGHSLGVLPRLPAGRTLGGFLSGSGLGEGSLVYGSIHSSVLSVNLATPARGMVEVTAGDASIPLEEILGGEGQYGLITSARLKLRPSVEPHKLRDLPYITSITELAPLMYDLLEKEPQPRSVLSYLNCTHPDGPVFRANIFMEGPQTGIHLESRPRSPLGKDSVYNQLLLPGELLTMLAELACEERFPMYISFEALSADSYMAGLALSYGRTAAEETTAHKRMYEVRETLISHGAKPCGYGFWQQGELLGERGEIQLRALKALKARFDPGGLINRGRTLELRTKHGAVVDFSILKPGSIRMKGLFGGGM